MSIHHFDLRVYFEDTDAAGIVYYANYLKFAERARTEAVRDLGIEHSLLMDETGENLVFAVRRVEIDYLSPAKLDDLLEVKTRFVEIKGASLTLEQLICRKIEDRPLARLVVVLVAMSLKNQRPVRIPDELRARLQGIVTERRI